MNALPCPSLEFVPFEARSGALIAGKYTLMRLLGVGGMGTVWSARNEATGAEVALKFLVYQTEDDAREANERLRQEARATARLSHRGIVRVYDMIDASEGGARLALVMELLHGRTLASYLDERVRLGVDEALGIVLPLLSAVAHAHAAGVIHRDLKPENIFLAVEPDGLVTPTILDFGVSKVKGACGSPIVTRDGEMSGTPSYMSPEQIRGTVVDARSDLFNVGILLYEMLSGVTPFGGEGVNATLAAVLEHTPGRIDDIPLALWNVIERALAKTPDERFESAAALASALRAAAFVPPRPSAPPPVALAPHVTITPAPLTRSRRSPLRGWPFVGATLGAALVTAVASAALALWTTEEPRAARGYAPLTAIAAAQVRPPTIAPASLEAIEAPLATIELTPVDATEPRPAASINRTSTARKPASPRLVPDVTLVRDPGF